MGIGLGGGALLLLCSRSIPTSHVNTKGRGKEEERQSGHQRGVVSDDCGLWAVLLGLGCLARRFPRGRKGRSRYCRGIHIQIIYYVKQRGVALLWDDIMNARKLVKEREWKAQKVKKQNKRTPFVPITGLPILLPASASLALLPSTARSLSKRGRPTARVEPAHTCSSTDALDQPGSSLARGGVVLHWLMHALYPLGPMRSSLPYCSRFSFAVFLFALFI